MSTDLRRTVAELRAMVDRDAHHAADIFERWADESDAAENMLWATKVFVWWIATPILVALIGYAAWVQS
jgi:hypothetical protein